MKMKKFTEYLISMMILSLLLLNHYKCNGIPSTNTAANNNSEMSATDSFIFDSVNLCSPSNLIITFIDDTAILQWTAPCIPDTILIPGRIHTNELPQNSNLPSLFPDLNPHPQQVNIHKMTDQIGGRGSKAYGKDLLSYTLFNYDLQTYTYTTFGSVSQYFSGGDFSKSDTSHFYAIDYYTNGLYSIDKETGIVTFIGGNTPLFEGGSFTGMACDKAGTGTMYISYSDMARSQIGIVNLSTGEQTPLGSPTLVAPAVTEIAINGEGQMYAWDIEYDASYIIDKETGDFTYLGSLGYDLNYAQGGNYDPVTQQIYMSAYSVNGMLAILDQTTGAMTYITSIAGERDIFAFASYAGNNPDSCNIYGNTG